MSKRISPCSRSRRRIPLQIDGIPKHSRPRRPPSRSPKSPIRQIRLLQLQNGRLPRHPLRANPPSILPELRHLRHRGFHLRRLIHHNPKLLNHRPAPNGEPIQHRDSPRAGRYERNLRASNPQLQNRTRTETVRREIQD